MPSTVIANIGYNPDELILTVVFNSGKVYKYRNVPAGVYLTLKTARSKGGYFNKYIKGSYEYTEVQ